MMIAPETYYRNTLEGQSPEFILRQIHSLRREIRRLIRLMETDPLNPEAMRMPNLMTRIQCSREYLQMAAKAYAETGQTLEPTKTERKDAAFNARLPRIRKLTVEQDGERLTATFSGEKVQVMKECLSGSETGKAEPFLLGYTFPEFVKSLERLHMGEWKKTYSPPGNAPDTEWNLCIEYEGDEKPCTMKGQNAEPYNFCSLMDLLRGHFW